MMALRKRSNATTAKRRTSRAVTWSLVNTDKYANDLVSILDDISLDIDLDKRILQIEKALVDAAALSSNVKCELRRHFDEDRRRLDTMIGQRKEMAGDHSSSRAALSKLINKEIRSLRRKRQTETINDILTKSKGFKSSETRSLLKTLSSKVHRI